MGCYRTTGDHYPEDGPMVPSSLPSADGQSWAVEAVRNYRWGGTGTVQACALCAATSPR